MAMNDITKSCGVEQLIKLYGPVTVEVAPQTMLMSELESQDITTKIQ